MAELLLFCAAALCCAQSSSSGKAAADSQGTVEVLNPVPEQDEAVLYKRYIPSVVKKTKQNWFSIIPTEARPLESRKGIATIEFTIQPDGKVTDMKVVKQSGDDALDYAAWTAIKNSQPYLSFDKMLTVPYLKLRFIFLYNEKPDTEGKSEEAKPPQ